MTLAKVLAFLAKYGSKISLLTEVADIIDMNGAVHFTKNGVKKVVIVADDKGQFDDEIAEMGSKFGSIVKTISGI